MVNKIVLSLDLLMTKKSKHSTSLIPEKLKFIADLGRTNSWISNRYAKFLKPYGISPQQLNILRVLRMEKDWVAMCQVNELLIIKSPNITRLADKLLESKLIDRNRSAEDRRVVFIKITEKGRRLLTRFDKEHEGELSDYMNSFTKREAVMMSEILKKIRT